MSNKRLIKQVLLLVMLMLPTMVWSADGDTFTATTAEGVVVTYQVINSESKICQVGYTYDKKKGVRLAIDASTTGEVTIPSEVNGYTVKYVGDYAFSSCSNVTAIGLPESIVWIGKYAFNSCTSAVTISYPPTASFSDTGRLFAGCESLKSIYLKEGLTKLGPLAFYNCKSLESVTLPSTLTSLGTQVFSGCSSLTSLILPDNIATIGYSALTNTSLTTLTLPASFSSITDAGTGIGTINTLNKVVVPKGVSGLYEVFKYCPYVETVICYNETPVNAYGCWQSSAASFDGILYVPNGSKEAYQADDNWKRFATIEEMDPNVDYSSIGNAFGVDGITYKITSVNPLEVQVGLASEQRRDIDGSLIIPSTIFDSEGKEYAVTSIGYSVFYSCSHLTSVTIPCSVKRISPYSLPYSLTSVIVEWDSPISISDYVFSNASASTLYVPYGCGDAYKNADCWKEFKEIVEMAPPSPNIEFADANVKALCVANWDTNGDGELSEEEAAAVTDLGEVFEENTTITSFDELQYFTSLTAIGNSAFQGCSGLTNISIPISVTSIGTFAFSGCSVLTMVNIPNQETSIGGKAFYGTAWFNNQPDGLVYIGKVAYSYKGTMPPNTEIVLKEGTTEIATGAFDSCTGLKSIYLPNSLKHIGYEVFYGCSGLTNISIPNTVASIGGDAFHGCTSLSSVNIPDGLTQIEYNTFYGCSSLSSVVIPRSVTSIGDYAFYGCSGLTSVTVKWETPLSISDYTFYVFYGSHTNNATLYVPKGTKAVYEADYYWKKFKEIVEMEKEIVSTDISQMDNVIYIEPTEERTGTATTISFKMKNTAAIRGFQFDLELPEGVTPMEEDGEYVYWLNADRAPKKAGGQFYHTLEVTKQADGTYRFLCGAQQNKTFKGNDGEVAVLKVNIADDMKEGDYPIILRNIKLTETDISNYYQTAEVVTTLTIVNYIPGDISGDGIVDVSDYIGVANHILGNTPAGFNARAADVNNDNVIDVSDYIGIANIILTGSIYGNNNAAARLVEKNEEQNPQ